MHNLIIWIIFSFVGSNWFQCWDGHIQEPEVPGVGSGRTDEYQVGGAVTQPPVDLLRVENWGLRVFVTGDLHFSFHLNKQNNFIFSWDHTQITAVRSWCVLSSPSFTFIIFTFQVFEIFAFIFIFGWLHSVSTSHPLFDGAPSSRPTCLSLQFISTSI